jgi:uncharacterized repeat protein (TIGR04076 family)
MSTTTPKCRITVLQRTLNRDLIHEYLSEEYEEIRPCEVFSDGQQFVLDGFEEMATVPEGFCAWAWADIRHDILRVASGGEMLGLKQPGTAIAGCTDWSRPVIFKIERIEGD